MSQIEKFHCPFCRYYVEKGEKKCNHCGKEIGRRNGIMLIHRVGYNKEEKNKLQNYFHMWNLRVGKKEYIIKTIKFIIIWGLLYLIVHFINIAWISIVYYIVFGFFFIFDYMHKTIGRFHDIGKSGRQLLIPLFNIYLWFSLFFIDGQKGDNKYGENVNKILIRLLRIDMVKWLFWEAHTRGNISKNEMHNILYSGTYDAGAAREKASTLIDAGTIGETYDKLYKNRFRWNQTYQYKLEEIFDNYYDKYDSDMVEERFKIIRQKLDNSVITLGSDY